MDIRGSYLAWRPAHPVFEDVAHRSHGVVRERGRENGPLYYEGDAARFLAKFVQHPDPMGMVGMWAPLSASPEGYFGACLTGLLDQFLSAEECLDVAVSDGGHIVFGHQIDTYGRYTWPPGGADGSGVPLAGG